MKGQQKVVETVEGNIQLQEVATGEDPTSVAIASIQSASTFSDPAIKYVFRTENGGTQVMYRVIQVGEGLQDGQTEGTNAISGFPGAQTMAQAVIQGAFSTDDGVEADNTTTETHYTYFPSTAVADASNTLGQVSTTTTVVTAQNTEAILGQGASPGQFFVMMSSGPEVIQTGPQRTIAPRTHPYSPFEHHLSTQGQNLKHRKADGPRTTRDEKRRAQHNEVERRRRDKINNWIVQLSKIIPDCSIENTKPGQGPVSNCLADSSQNLNDGSAESDANSSQSSKGGILSKACDYIQELRQGNLRLSEELQGLTQLQMDNQVLRQQVEDLQDKNRILHAQLRQHGVEVIIKSSPH